jgi:metal-responsive CopG/Arc/MetJ family transcriptional regulator
MSSHRTHVVLPDELIKQIDELVGKRGRSAFLAEVAEKEIKRRKLLQLLDELSSRPGYSDQDYPEWKDGSAEWVHNMRQNDQKLRDAKLRKLQLGDPSGHEHSD